MNDLNVLLAVAGVAVTLMVVVAMVLLTPRGTEPLRKNAAPFSESAESLTPAAEKS